jgi:site-specific recombinase XerD
VFDQLFSRPWAQQRHLNSPLLKERLDYLRHCAEQGYKLRTLRELAQDLLRIQNLLGLAAFPNALDPTAIETAVKNCVRRRTRPSTSYKDGRRKRIFSVTMDWLRFLKRLRLPSVALPVYQRLKEEFADYSRIQKGVSPGTIRTWCGFVEDFLQWFFRNHESLHQLRIADLDEAIARKGRDDGYARATLQGYSSALRAFLRYAEHKSWCSPGLAAGVVSPRLYRGERLPRGPFWNDVQRLIATTEGDMPQDIRDRAVLLLLAVYALRSGEVRALKLDDVDWERNLLFIPRSKGRRTEPYPLSPTVGAAIVQYLEIRPRSSYREIFLRLRAPLRPLSSSAAIWRIVAKRARALDPPVVPHGPHAFRHACATHLLEQGLSLKEIGDHLGHRSLNSTALYAPMNLPGLREVANLSLGGLL